MMGAATLTDAPMFGSDHQSFDAVGLPAFQFIQDPVEYETRTHHSNQDLYDRLQADDLAQAAVIMATFVFNAATREERLPRKPMPESARGTRLADPGPGRADGLRPRGRASTAGREVPVGAPPSRIPPGD